MSKKVFRGEVWTNTHPEIMEELLRINELEVDGKVGHDGFTKSATELMQKNFNFFDSRNERFIFRVFVAQRKA